MKVCVQLKYISALLLLLCGFYTQGQDIHFSQYNMSPLNLNPAFTGLFDGDYRAGAIYRSQWSAVPVPYSTVSLMGDAKLKTKSNHAGVGLLFNNDVSGDSKYGTTQLSVPLSYIARLNSDSSLYLSVGLQPGITNIGFRTNQQTFDNQFDGDSYNPALPTGENFPAISHTYFDVASGLVLQYHLSQQTIITGGISLSHFNKPKISYFNNADIRLDPKIVSSLSFNFPIAQRLSVNTELMYERQGKFHETVLGAKCSYALNSKDRQAVSAGFYTRLQDALVMRVGYDYKQWQFGMSYDINTSAFRAATNRRGAIEFALIYIFKKESIFIPKKRVCPIYM